MQKEVILATKKKVGQSTRRESVGMWKKGSFFHRGQEGSRRKNFDGEREGKKEI